MPNLKVAYVHTFSKKYFLMSTEMAYKQWQIHDLWVTLTQTVFKYHFKLYLFKNGWFLIDTKECVR